MAGFMDYVQQAAAGLIETPGIAGQVAGAALDPLYTYQRMMGRPLNIGGVELASPGTGWGAQLARGGEQWTNLTNSLMGVHSPSPQDETGLFAARTLGGALIPLPLRAPLAAARVASPVSQGARALGTAAELLTPFTVVPQGASAARVGATMAGNVASQVAGGAVVENLIEDFDPTQPIQVLDSEGNPTGTIPAKEPGAGRIAVNAVANNPGTSGLVGAAAIGGAMLFGRATRNAAARQAELATSDVIQPIRVPDENVPLDAPGHVPPAGAVAGGPVDQAVAAARRASPTVDTAAAEVNNRAHSFAETWQDRNILVKDKLNSEASSPEVAARLGGQLDLANIEPSHRARFEAFMDTGIMDTLGGPVRMQAPREFSDGLAAYAKQHADPTFLRRADEAIMAATEMDNRNYAKMRGQKVEIETPTGTRAYAGTPHGTPTQWITPRATLPHLDDLQVEARYRQGLQDPEIKVWLDKHADIASGAREAMIRNGSINPAIGKKFVRADPNFAHILDEADPKDPLALRRRLHEEGPKYLTDPTRSWDHYFDYLMKHFSKNIAGREIVRELEKSQTTRPHAQRWVGNIYDPERVAKTWVTDRHTGVVRKATRADFPELKGNVYRFRENGVIKEAEILNDSLYKALKEQPQAAKTMLGIFRRTGQSAMTGKIAIFIGQAFAVANAMMGIPMSMITRPRGMKYGAIQAPLYKMTGGKFDLRLDPTVPFGMANSMVREVSAIMGKAVSETLQYAIKSDSVLGKLPGAQRIADKTAQMFIESSYHWRRRSGAGDVSTTGTQDWDSNAATRHTGGWSPYMERERVVSSPETFMEHLKELKRSGTTGGMRIAARAFGEVYDAISNIPQGYLFRSNRDPFMKAMAEGEQHAAKWAAVEASAKPHFDNAMAALQVARQRRAHAAAYRKAGNTVQAKAEYAQARQLYAHAKQETASARHILQSGMSHKIAADKSNALGYGELHKVGHASRMLLGDPGMSGAAIRDMGKNQTVGRQVAAAMIDGVPYANISIQAMARLARAIKENPLGTTAAIAVGVGGANLMVFANAIRLDNDLIEAGQEPVYVKHLLSRPSWEVTRFMPLYIGGHPPEQAARYRMDPQFSFPNAAIFNMMASFLKLEGDPRHDPLLAYTRDAVIRMANDRAKQHIWTAAWNSTPFGQLPAIMGVTASALGMDVPALDQLISRGGAQPINQRGQGGFEQSRLAFDVVSKRVEGILEAIWGSAATTLIDAVRAGYQGERHQQGTFVPQALDTMAGKALDRAPETAPLWNTHQSRLPTTDATSELVNAKERTVKTIEDNWASISRPGGVGSGRNADVGQFGGRRGVDDPQMERLMADIRSQGSQIQRSLTSERATLREHMLEVGSSGMRFDDRRALENHYAQQIRTLNRRILAEWYNVEDRLSAEYGREIRIDQLNPTRPITQFRERRATSPAQ